MALKKYKPTTPGQRQLVLVDRSALERIAHLCFSVGRQSTPGGHNFLHESLHQHFFLNQLHFLQSTGGVGNQFTQPSFLGVAGVEAIQNFIP